MTTHRRLVLAAAVGAACAMAAPALLRHARASSLRLDSSPFGLGVASGLPRPDSVVLWTRLMGEELPPRVTVQWEVAKDESFRQVIASGSQTAEASWAHSVHAEPTGLEPGRSYWFRFTALGERSSPARTRTAPAPDSAATLRLATASCQRLEHGHFAAWRDIGAFEPDLVLFLGDYIYEYPGAPDAVRSVSGGLVSSLQGYRERYAQYKADPLLQAAHAAAPWAVVWDDHEVANDYAGLQAGLPLADFEARRAAAYRAWWEHMPLPMSARPQGAQLRIHTHLDWGRLARILLLDNRQYRDPQACRGPLSPFGAGRVRERDCPALADAQRSMLGREQERWLEQQFSTQHRWNLLAQQTLMTPLRLSDDGEAQVWTDGWDGYAPARERLLQGAAARRVPGLVVLGGDIHAHVVANLRADASRNAAVVGTELCGTSISSRGPAAARFENALAQHPHVVWGQARKRGSVLLDLNEQLLRADMRAVDNPRDASSPVRSAARFAVEARHAGAQHA